MGRSVPSSSKPALEGGTPTRTEFLVFGKPRIGEEEIQEVAAALRSGWIGTGPRVQKFEREFLSYTGGSHAVAVSSCTAALHLSLLAAGVASGSEVVVPAMTFVATANAVLHAGGTPVFADCDRGTFNVTAASIAAAITPRTRAVVPVHFAGHPCPMDAILGVTADARIRIVEDCAHCIEGTIGGRHAGTFGDFGAFSFYPTKNVTSIEGGMIVTGDAEAAERMRISRLHGLSRDAWKRFGGEGYRHYQAETLGYKYNMTDVQAAVGIHQLHRVARNLELREGIWRRYDEAFRPLPAALPAPPGNGVRHARHLYTLLLDLDRLRVPRDTVLEAIQMEGIGVGVHYIAVPLHPYYRDRFGFREGMFPNAEYVSARTLSVPLTPYLDDQDVEDVIMAVTKVLLYYSR
ncbi:MAG TPA: DegT/DnrJ/EryC1/StrS aminotransferase family protein [Candidatus Deferrimicrobium sp.]|nr:DegT/DnrJ/EryC1/StrS aminotransferase family protein [Candidatus Deferrimicrobium sp.]